MRVSEDPRVGTELAGYRIESLLGFGGMSVVYLAEDLRLKRKVALKLLDASLAGDESFRDRFLRESEVAASIDHPNIVPIYEAGTTEDLLYIAMRYVEGRDLGERLQGRRLEPAEAINILLQVASALDAAHARGLVHRDVKPSNVLVDSGARPDGSDHVYLADFGLTREVTESARAGDDGHLLGTIDYIAPEQIAGEEIDGRADVYSLGCVLYECLVGRPPFRSDSNVAVVFAHLETEPPAPSTERPELPAALDAVVARALAKDPGDRYATCRDFARAALAVAVDEASRRLLDVASRAAAGKSDLSEVEAELTGKVIDLQLAREQARALSGLHATPRIAGERICPFKGLASFEPVDAEYFFGRERLVAELIARLVGEGLLGIVGPSGSGKSSVLRAGLLPALAAGVLPGSEGWRRLLLRPGERPLEELRRALVSGSSDPLGEALDTLPPGGRLVLAVDQLEELFTACRADTERAAFAGALARAASDRDGRALVVVALRADFYGRFAAFPELADHLGGNQVLVGPMQASELRRAVELPGARVGLHAQSELVDALVDDVEGEPGALPLLSTALLELWQKREDDVLTLASYRDSGGVHGAVARLAEGTYARIPEEQKQLARAVMLRLVGEDEGESPVRRRAPLAELDLERNEGAATVLATLADSRLVTVGEGSVEVAHEALLREWPRLRGWIEEDADGRRLRRHLTEAATEWSAGGRDPGELYRGARLAAALDWSAEHAFELNELEREFVGESRELSEKETARIRRTNHRLRALLAGVAVFLVAAVVGGVLAVIQRSEARDAETAQVAQRLGAQALVEEDLDRSLLLARQAVAIDDSPQTRGYLLQDLLRSPAALGVMHAPDGAVLRAVAVSPDGRTLAVGGLNAIGDPTVPLLFFDARSFEPVGGPVPVASGVLAVAYSPEGKTLAVAGFRTVQLFDARTHEELANAPASMATRLAFTQDGSRLVVAESADPFASGRDDGWISVRDAASLEPIGDSIHPAGYVGAYISQLWVEPSIALTPDGRSLVTTSVNGELTWWDLDSRERTRTMTIPPGYRALALSRDGRTAAVGLDDGIRLIDVRSGATREAQGVLPATPSWLLFTPDGKTLASTSRGGPVSLWDVGRASLRQTLEGHSDAVWQPVFSPDGRTLYTASHDGTAIAWDVDGTRRFERRFAFTPDHGRYTWPDVHPGRFSPDARVIAVGLSYEGIALLDAGDLSRIGAPLLPTDGEVTELAFSPDGRRLVAATDRGSVTVWDMESRTLLRGPFANPGGVALSAAISSDGAVLASSYGDGVRLWSLSTGAMLGRLGDAGAGSSIVFSPTRQLLAFVRDERYQPAGRSEIEIWDTLQHSLVRTIAFDGVSPTGWALAFSPDGRTLAIGGLDPVVRLWDVGSGRLVQEFEHNVGRTVWALEFSPDGSVLVVSGGDGFASLRDVATGRRIGPRLGIGSREAMLDLSSDGHKLLLTHGDGKAAIWTVDAASWMERACSLANRTLTREEWDEFLPGRAYEPACR